MKKNLLITAAFAMLFVGCSKEIDEPIQNDEPIVDAIEEITAIAPSDTKTTIDGLDLKWAGEDAITVFDTSAGSHEFTLKTGAGTPSATFEGSLGGGTAGTYALYPHAAANVLAGNAATVVYPDTYEYGNAPAPLLGTNGGANTYTFANVGGVLRIAYSNAPAFATTFEIESTANICGAYTIDDVTSGMAGSFTDGAKKVTITDLPGTSDLEFFIPLPAGDYTFTVRLKAGDNLISASQKTVGSAKSITVGHMKTLGSISLPNAITVTKSITDLCTDSDDAMVVTPLDLNGDGIITIGQSGNGNNGKYYKSDHTLRYYTGGGAMTISLTGSYELKKVKVTFSGALSGLTSGTEVLASGSSASYSCTSNAKVTAISVTYMSTTGTANSSKVATPSISCVENTVTITCGTAGASIYYTDNGDAPTTASAPYTAPFAIAANKTIKAIAVKEHMQNSDVASEDCVYESLKCATPTITCTNNYVTISCATEGASIRYTTDGSTTPTDAVGTEYSDPFFIDADTHVKAVAYKAGYSNSDVASADCEYENVLATPTNVEITDITKDASISFKWDDVTNATGYNWIISTKSTYDSAKDDVFTSGSATGTSVTKTGINPASGTVYYLYVQATDESSTYDSSSWGVGHAILYQHVFNTKPSTGSSIALSSVNWNITAENLGSYNSANYAGVQLGSSGSNGSITLTSSSAWGGQSGSYYGFSTVKKVALWLNKGGTSVTPSVSVGGKAATSDGTTVVKNSSAGPDYTKATRVTFAPASDGKTGVVVASVSTVKAGYICALEVLSE